jgi:amino acid permease
VNPKKEDQKKKKEVKNRLILMFIRYKKALKMLKFVSVCIMIALMVICMILVNLYLFKTKDVCMDGEEICKNKLDAEI